VYKFPVVIVFARIPILLIELAVRDDTLNLYASRYDVEIELALNCCVLRFVTLRVLVLIEDACKDCIIKVVICRLPVLIEDAKRKFVEKELGKIFVDEIYPSVPRPIILEVILRLTSDD